MNTALIFNRVSGFHKTMTALEFEREFAGNVHLNITPRQPEVRDDLDIICQNPGEQYGDLMDWRRSYIRNGNPKDIARAAFVLPKGSGGRDHMYEHEAAVQENMEEAVRSGKHILIRLNQKFTVYDVDFNYKSEPGGRNLEQWISHVKGNYAGFSANSADEVAQKLRLAKKIHDGRSRLSDKIWFLHKGVILPYKEVVIGNNEWKLSGLYNHLVNHKGGVPFKSKSAHYHVGFPRFLLFVPIKEENPGGLVLGNHVKSKFGKPLLTQLTCPTRNGETDQNAYRKLKNRIRQNGEEGMWVLASPYARPDTYDPRHCSLIHWHVGNQETQIHAANDNQPSGRHLRSHRAGPGKTTAAAKAKVAEPSIK